MSERDIISMGDSLYFSNPVFKEGLNLTVRKGTKWSGKEGIHVSRITGTNEPISNIQILDTKVKPLREVTQDELEHEHDPECTTLEGLHKELNDVYGQCSMDEMVTLVFFVEINYWKDMYDQVKEKYGETLKALAN